MLDDIQRAEDEIEKNFVSLNREERLKELSESEEERQVRTKEREDRFAKIEEQDKKNFKIYKLTLDHLDDEVLPLVDPSKEEESYIRSLVDELDDLEQTLRWPSGVDSVKREGLQVLRDLVDLTQSRRVALAPSGN